ncbi:MAG TPA: YggS family pyridoxal phosphate-dependent enzyme [Gammaproteobacteria bacterium]|nr:YggS family pyridoxal phosphate-dependent enzyme [Gammaproteobacteria bacterium]
MPVNADTIADNLENVRRTVTDAAERWGRNTSAITVLAVSKTKPPEAIQAAAAAGQRDFGENYLQEALAKMDAVADPALRWHFIGAIQSNKTRPIADRFDWVHTVDREKIARRLHEQRPDDLPPLNVCLEVNVSDEPQKAGAAPEEVEALAEVVVALPRLKLRGLMALPAPAEAFEVQREPFKKLAALYEQLRAKGFDIDTLSMGMSGDFEAAIAEGATIVRIGTAIFGERAKRTP